MSTNSKEKVENFRAYVDGSEADRKVALSKGRSQSAAWRERTKNNIHRLERDVASYEDKLRSRGIDFPGPKFPKKPANDNSSASSKFRNKYLPPPEKLERMSEEELSRWKKVQRLQRNKIRKAAVASYQKELAQYLETRLSTLIAMYPGESSSPSDREPPKKVESKSYVANQHGDVNMDVALHDDALDTDVTVDFLEKVIDEKSAAHSETKTSVRPNKVKSSGCSEAAIRRKNLQKKLEDLEEEVKWHEDMLHSAGIKFSHPQFPKELTKDDESSSSKNPHKYLPPPEELKRMSKEDLSKWRKERRLERNRILKAAKASQQQILLNFLETRLLELKETHGRTFKLDPICKSPNAEESCGCVLSAIDCPNAKKVDDHALPDIDGSAVNTIQTVSHESSQGNGLDMVDMTADYVTADGMNTSQDNALDVAVTNQDASLDMDADIHDDAIDFLIEVVDDVDGKCTLDMADGHQDGALDTGLKVDLLKDESGEQVRLEDAISAGCSETQIRPKKAKSHGSSYSAIRRNKLQKNIEKLEKDVASYEDMLCSAGIKFSHPQFPKELKKDDKSSLSKNPNKFLPPPEELKLMTKEDLSKWRKNKRLERNKILKAAKASHEKNLLNFLETRLLELKRIYSYHLALKINPICRSSNAVESCGDDISVMERANPKKGHACALPDTDESAVTDALFVPHESSQGNGLDLDDMTRCGMKVFDGKTNEDWLADLVSSDDTI